MCGHRRLSRRSSLRRPTMCHVFLPGTRRLVPARTRRDRRAAYLPETQNRVSCYPNTQRPAKLSSWLVTSPGATMSNSRIRMGHLAWKWHVRHSERLVNSWRRKGESVVSIFLSAYYYVRHLTFGNNKGMYLMSRLHINDTWKTSYQ